MEVELMRQIIVTPDEDGVGYTVECPSLPGCHSQGDTWEEAIANIREAIYLYIEVLEEDGLPVPDDRLDRVITVV
jgi:predicted RNase H-like HicB family nuclease